MQSWLQLNSHLPTSMSTVSEQLRINVPQPSLCHQVFVGPPYNSFPLPGDVEYAASSIVFNITTYQSWMNKTMLWELPTAPEGHALSSTDAWFWMPDTPVDHVALELETAGSIVATLRRVTAAEIDQRLAAVEEQRRFFHVHRTLDAKRKCKLTALYHPFAATMTARPRTWHAACLCWACSIFRQSWACSTRLFPRHVTWSRLLCKPGKVRLQPLTCAYRSRPEETAV